MKAKQLYYVLIALLVLFAIGLFGVAYGANKLMGSQATKLSKLRADSVVADNQETSLAANKKDVSKYSELNTIAESIVPQDKDQAEAVGEIVSLANQSGISDISSISFPASTLGTASLGPVSATGSSTPAPSVSSHISPNLTQLTPVTGITGVYELQITVNQSANSEVPYDSLTTFLGKLEQNRRTAEVSSINVQPDAAHPGMVSFTLVIDEFIKP